MLSEDVKRAAEIVRVISEEFETPPNIGMLLTALLLTDKWTQEMLEYCGTTKFPKDTMMGNVDALIKKHGDKPVTPEFIEFVHKIDVAIWTKPMDILILAINDEAGVQFLESSGCDVAKLHASLEESEQTAAHAQDMVLEKFCDDFITKVDAGEYWPIVSRADEMNKLLSVLCRKSKNNALIIGKPGVGKTSIAVELAYRLIHDDVPGAISGKKIYELSVGALMRDIGFRGSLETRVDGIMHALKESGETILLIDDMGALIAMEKGGNIGHSSSLLSIFKKYADHPNVSVVGILNDEDLISVFDSNSGALNKFQQIKIEEPDFELTKEIVENTIDIFEDYHGVKVPEENIDLAIRMSTRYIKDRSLPEKALDILDESMADAIITEERPSDKENDLIQDVEDLDQKVMAYVDENKFIDATDTVLKISKKQKNIQKMMKARSRGGEKITLPRESVIECISRWTGIPIGKLTQSNREKLLNMIPELGKKVVGQNEAIETVSKSILRSGTSIKRSNAPIGCFMFTGPSGVGKTELSKRLAEYLYPSDNNFLRLDMSEFSQEHLITRLIGSSAGYVGFGKGGQLTNHVKKYPYSLVLFDEIEKAHPNFYNLLLQIMDAGRLTDSMGQEIDFSNTVVVMTTNLGLRKETTMKGKLGFGDDTQTTSDDDLAERAKKNLIARFNAEFVNRLDAVIQFRSLDRCALLDIVDIQIGEFNEYMSKHETPVEVSLNKRVKNFIVDEAMRDQDHPNARPLKRIIERLIENKVAEHLVATDTPDRLLKFGLRGGDTYIA